MRVEHRCGEGTYRLGERRLPVSAGDCLGAPAGGEGHQIVNTGAEPLRYLAFSNNGIADVVEHLDTGRIRIDIGARGAHRENATFAAGGRLAPMDYWEGELAKSDWFAGSEFSGADIQMSFPLEAAAARGGLEQGHPRAMAYLERIHARPAYARALEKGGPYAVGR